MYEKKFTLRHAFQNFSSLDHEWSPAEEHFGVEWNLQVLKEREWISVYLRCDNEEDNSWWIDTVYKMQLVPVKGDKLMRQGSHTFYGDSGIGWNKFNSLEDTLLEFVQNDTLTIECEVTIKKINGIAVAEKRKMMFDEPEEHLTDVVLEVGEQKFHVSKVILATHSSYFKTLFFGGFSESKMANVELKDVDPWAFQLFLEVIYGELNINGYNVSDLLQLADQFDVKVIRKRCEEFVQRNDKMSKKEKMRLADTYNLKNLKRHILDSIKTSKNLRAYLPNNLADLSHSTLVALLEKNRSQGISVKDNTATIKKMTGIALKRKMIFDEPEEHLTDVVLEVGEQKFHVSKVILATHSSYFKTLFFGGFSESKKANVELKEVDPEAFQLFLEVIYGELNINGDTLYGLLQLSDQFDVKVVRQRCVEFVQRDDKMAKHEKMRLADTFDLENLKRHILDSVKTSEDLRAYLPINLADLSHSTLVALFEKNLSLC